jgi:hypothetical protein
MKCSWAVLDTLPSKTPSSAGLILLEHGLSLVLIDEDDPLCVFVERSPSAAMGLGLVSGDAQRDRGPRQSPGL